MNHSVQFLKLGLKLVSIRRSVEDSVEVVIHQLCICLRTFRLHMPSSESVYRLLLKSTKSIGFFLH